MNFIKLNLVSDQGKEHDHSFFLNTELIAALHHATSHNRRMRQEINALVFLTNGNCYGVTQHPATIANLIRNSDMTPIEEEEG